MRIKKSNEQKAINKKVWEENKDVIFKVITYYYNLGWRYNCIAVILNLKYFKTSTGNGWHAPNVIYTATKVMKLPERIIRIDDFNEKNSSNVLDLLDLFQGVSE